MLAYNNKLDGPSASSSATDLLAALSKDSPSSSMTSNPYRIRHPSTSPSGSSSTLRKPLPSGNSTSNTRVLNLISRASSRNQNRSPSAEQRANIAQDLKNHKLAQDMTRQISRRWKVGDVYAPHDLSPVEMEKWKRRGRPE